MNIELESDKKLEFSDMIINLDKSIRNINLYSSNFDSETKVKYLMKEWYIKGYMKALDDYEKLMK